MATVAFDLDKFLLRFPEFSSIDGTLLGMFFGEATDILNPTDSSRVADEDKRRRLLYLLTAHITKLNAGSNGQSASGMVGRINSATQGSVTVSTDYVAATNARAWYDQTPYGAQYWAQTAQYRTMRYVR